MYFNQRTHACAWVHMVEIGWKHWKMRKNSLSIIHTRGSQKANEEKRRKFQMSNQHLGVTQLLGVTPNRWPTNFFFIFLRFSSCALREPLMQMMKKILFYSFSSVFDCFRPCERVRKHVFAGWNTQQIGFSDHKLECVYAIKYFFSGIPIAIFTSSIQWVKIA